MVMINSLTELVVLNQSYSVTVTCHLRYIVIFGNLYVLIDKERKKERKAVGTSVKNKNNKDRDSIKYLIIKRILLKEASSFPVSGRSMHTFES